VKSILFTTPGISDRNTIDWLARIVPMARMVSTIEASATVCASTATDAGACAKAGAASWAAARKAASFTAGVGMFCSYIGQIRRDFGLLAVHLAVRAAVGDRSVGIFYTFFAALRPQLRMVGISCVDSVTADMSEFFTDRTATQRPTPSNLLKNMNSISLA
jgi:hypothetical protein